MRTFGTFETIVRDTTRRLQTGDLAALVSDALSLLERFQTGRTLTRVDGFRLALALHVIEIRDKAVLGTRERVVPGCAARWTRLATSVPPAFVAPAATLSGYASLLAGDSDGAVEALKVALRADPGYELARFLRLHVAMSCLFEPFRAVDELPYDFANPDGEWFAPLTERIALHEQLRRLT